jgi:hypothetical protein
VPKDVDHYINPSSPAYVLAGGAGCDEMVVGVGSDGGMVETSDKLASAPAAWNAYADAQFGTGVLKVINRTTIQWQYIHSADMTVADQFYITKGDILHA